MGRLSLIAQAAALSVLPFVGDAVAATCDPGRVMVLFDRSTSMVRGEINGQSKWSIATAALRGVVLEYQSKAEFGLATFPQQDFDCKTGGKVVVNPPALNAYTAISNGLSAATPSGAAWTPLGQAVKEMSELSSLGDSAKRRYLIVVSDGAQDCPVGTYSVGTINQSADIWGTDTIVDHVETLRAKGVKVFVIGFGKASSGSGDDGVDAYTLNQMARAGGSGKPGCDAASDDVEADDNCYYQADNADELSAAFEEIAIEISEETCDGEDNNCNGLVDENLVQNCSSACGPGTQRCVAGEWGACSATQPDPETCDGEDNDCDGQTDEGCACRNGETRPCGKPEGNWICKPGIQRCVNGQWSTACEGEIGPQPETCDGIDTNCDGIGDVDCVCLDGETAECGGPNVGQCRTGTKSCVNGDWGSCIGAVGPSPEECDGIDNDCDGVIDEPTLGSDDDVPHGLCRIDQICDNGACVDVPPMMPPPTGSVPGDAAGCACTVGAPSAGGAPLGGLLLGALFAAGLVARRARRR